MTIHLNTVNTTRQTRLTQYNRAWHALVVDPVGADSPAVEGTSKAYVYTEHPPCNNVGIDIHNYIRMSHATCETHNLTASVGVRQRSMHWVATTAGVKYTFWIKLNYFAFFYFKYVAFFQTCIFFKHIK